MVIYGYVHTEGGRRCLSFDAISFTTGIKARETTRDIERLTYELFSHLFMSFVKEVPPFEVEYERGGRVRVRFQTDAIRLVIMLVFSSLRFGNRQTLREVGRNMGAKNRSQFLNYENGKRHPSIETFARLIEALGLEFVLGVEERKSESSSLRAAS